jgi:glyoxylase-like metal-dependent hydrolase (beta-lactamase superfamily II)
MELQVAQFYDHISYLDNGLLDTPGLGTTYVLRGDDLAIVETGTSLCAPHVLDGLRRLGIEPSAVRHVLLTHIHMDHAGGAGTLLPYMPEATLYIHSRTAKYLVDPSDLLSSAERALGSLYPLHGTVEPAPPERIAAAEQLQLDLGRGVVVRAIETPGHSPDHIAYFDESSRSLFTGDAVGILIPSARYLGPVMPPPAISLDRQRETFDRLLDLPIETLLFTHFGPGSESPRALIERLSEQYERLVSLVQQGREAGNVDHDAITRAMMIADPPDERAALMVAGWVEMSIKGLMHFFDRQARKQS